MQIDETVHGRPVAVVHLIVRLQILALQVKSGPPRGNRLWLRPQAALWQSRASQKSGLAAGWTPRAPRPPVGHTKLGRTGYSKPIDTDSFGELIFPGQSIRQPMSA